ncbi:MAG: pyridoxamine 5'-phosphate oxidase family protein [Haliscomenobacter sp.]|nr:pyridoxamine 5'-phosphate oxidase family protein [Haliscomenobacter sp.]MBK8653616.1 pyridoxamine 5'-phosphate oxidase family protein [Haliscomenobacter sp.]MBP9076234.1 pyridoxamine 5'-phosphate oxidase family protein [Haliscomenobacter sp.]MBP9872812.1 pyridoxamine 5'-phosphate oxidase family protein [Haliscomenobacter sp.]
MPSSFKKNPRNTVRRLPSRGAYDRETIYGILDAGFLCHAGFTVDGQPFVIPTAYGREGDKLFFHGSIKSRMMLELGAQIPVCVTVTLLDGVVLARSAFHHSMNYRSVVLFGQARELVEPEEKDKALYCISEQILPGRWAEVRGPNANELAATSVLEMTIDEASAKIRTGGPKDDQEDYDLPIWAGVLPVQSVYQIPEPDPLLKESLEVSPSVLNAIAKQSG